MCGHRWSIVDVVTPPGFFFRICNETMKGRKEGGEGLNKKSRSKFPYPTLSALQFNAFSPPDFMFIRHRLLMESVCQRINWRRSVHENFRSVTELTRIFLIILFVLILASLLFPLLENSRLPESISSSLSLYFLERESKEQSVEKVVSFVSLKKD